MMLPMRRSHTNSTRVFNILFVFRQNRGNAESDLIGRASPWGAKRAVLLAGFRPGGSEPGNGGGYLTLSFIPTLGTMLLGLAAGRWLREAAPEIPYRKLLIAAAVGMAAGVVLHFTGICPVVKRIWTPSWTLFSGGLCFAFLALFCRLRAPVFLLVIGMNSIAAYLIAHLWERFIADSFRIHLGPKAFQFLGVEYEPLLSGLAVLGVYWLALFWMYRRKVFLKI